VVACSSVRENVGLQTVQAEWIRACLGAVDSLTPGSRVSTPRSATDLRPVSASARERPLVKGTRPDRGPACDGTPPGQSLAAAEARPSPPTTIADGLEVRLVHAVRPRVRCTAVTSQAYASATAPTVPPACGGRGADGPRFPRRGSSSSSAAIPAVCVAVPSTVCSPRKLRRLPDQQVVRHGSAATRGFVAAIHPACVGERLRD
jgi:hypothetical protein